jgi:chromosome segregation ATPase
MQAAVNNARSELEASQHQLQQEQAAAAQLQQRLEELQEQAMQVGLRLRCCQSRTANQQLPLLWRLQAQNA